MQEKMDGIQLQSMENQLVAILPAGELDYGLKDESVLRTIERLHEQLPESRQLCLDMRQITFLGSHGIRSLMRLKRHLGERPLHIIPSRAVACALNTIQGSLIFSVHTDSVQ